jgi:hypothetical protein
MRAISVNLEAIRLALTSVYPARHLADEMGLRQSRP